MKEIEIGNYRQFSKININFESHLTYLAGANNSGKTSIIDLIKNVILDAKCSLGMTDLPIKETQGVTQHLFEVINKKFNQNKGKEKRIESLQQYIYKEQDKQESIIPKTYMNMEISYSENENIGLFTDYLMDLDDNVKGFYFRFEYTYNLKRLLVILDERYEQIAKLKKEFDKLEEQSKNPNASSECLKELSDQEAEFKRKLLQWYFDSFEPLYYYTDRNYHIKEAMDRNEFRNLFHLDIISANKKLADGEVDRKYSIGQEIIKYVSSDEDWEKMIESFPSDLTELIDKDGKKDIIRDKSLSKLQTAIRGIEKTNGRNSADMFLDIVVEEETIRSLLNNTIQAKYQFDNAILNENAQGLGYSNLIYIHLKLEIFLKEIEKEKVNIFIIEEPEAHMHPQMQRVFSEYLKGYYSKSDFQGLVTTHSSEVVRVADLNCIRVIREKEMFTSNLYDLSVFLDEVQQEDEVDTELKKFFSMLFSLNLAELIFSDRAILYEGDTERMYIQSLIHGKDVTGKENFSALANLYIAYIQVGGA